jgi:hypothetical protein
LVEKLHNIKIPTLTLNAEDDILLFEAILEPFLITNNKIKMLSSSFKTLTTLFDLLCQLHLLADLQHL